MSHLETYLENFLQIITVPIHVRVINAKSRALMAKTEYGNGVDEIARWEKKQSQID